MLDRQERELFAYHWHPEGHSRVTFPHLHVAQGRVDYAGLLAKAHFPTGTIALRDVLRLMTEDFGVRPRREDWASVLASGNGAGG
ncbi:MAG: hypothetical protein NTZ05_18175 [Chloroflexi bacterium]|nr:hypothetical protein [Chloroflexota bacterium]